MEYRETARRTVTASEKQVYNLLNVDLKQFDGPRH